MLCAIGTYQTFDQIANVINTFNYFWKKNQNVNNAGYKRSNPMKNIATILLKSI